MGKQRYRKDVKQAIDNAKVYGFEVVHKSSRSNNHIVLQHRENGARITLPSTPSSYSWLRNHEADVKRYSKNGRPLPGM